MGAGVRVRVKVRVRVSTDAAAQRRVSQPAGCDAGRLSPKSRSATPRGRRRARG